MTRIKKIFFGFALVALLATVAAWLVLTSDALRVYLQQELALQLERATGGKVFIRSFELQFFPLKLVISDLRIAKESSPDLPFLAVPTIEANPHYASLFAIPRLRALTLREPQIRIQAGPDGLTNVPHPNSSMGANSLRLLVEKLDVKDGIASYNQQQTRFSTQLEGVELLANYLPMEGRYRGNFRHKKGFVRYGQNQWAYGLDASWSLSQTKLDLQHLSLITNESRLEARGAIQNLRDPSGEFTYQGDIGLAEARPLHRQLRDLQGTTHVAGTLSLSGDGWKTEGTLSGSALLMKTVKVEHFSSQFQFTRKHLELRRIQMTGLHGNAEGQLSIESPFANPRYKANFRLGNVGLLDLSLLAKLEKVRFAGELSGTLRAEWLDEGKQLAGEGHLRISEAPHEPAAHALSRRTLPIHGELNFDFSQSSSRFDRS